MFRYAPLTVGRRIGFAPHVLGVATPKAPEPILRTAEIVGMGGGLVVAIIGVLTDENIVVAIGSSLFAAGLFSAIVRHTNPPPEVREYLGPNYR